MTTEVAKVILFPHGEHTVNGKKVYKYVMGSIIVTSKPINTINQNEIILMGDAEGKIAEGLEKMVEYTPPYPLGDMASSMIAISHLSPKDLKKA